MKVILKVEEFGMTVIGIYFLMHHHLNISLWAWIFIFFLPDVSMLGYFINSKVGAYSYNLFHHKGLAIICGSIGYFMNLELFMTLGILLFAHASFDRVLGYGLKYQSSFNNTHLGKLKKDKAINTA